MNSGLADFTPVFLSEVPRLFRTERYNLDVAVIHISPPDAHGYSSYGVEVGVTKSAAEQAKKVIAEVNPNMLRTLGDSFIHVDQINCFIMADYELPEITPAPLKPLFAMPPAFPCLWSMSPHSCCAICDNKHLMPVFLTSKPTFAAANTSAKH